MLTNPYQGAALVSGSEWRSVSFTTAPQTTLLKSSLLDLFLIITN